MKKILLIFFLVGTVLLGWSYADAETIGQVETKGVFFKDKLKIEAFDDPSIQGVTCYTTVHDRALSLSDSSSTSLSCRQTGEIKGQLKNQKNVFSRSKSVFFKKTVVDRFYDKKRQVLVYITYTKDSSGKNASNSISVVVIKKER
jgi:CreA protein